ncbi:hypothetical protein [Methylophaga sp.]|uniref:hypothetical protein n=1 Tax=Methylophaga sp. TaxID=2024840 RepID=UPI003A8F2E63
MLLKLLGILFIAAGTAGLVIDDIPFTKKTHEADLGIIELQVDEKEIYHVPEWLGAISIGLGTLLLLVPNGHRRR